MMDVAHIGFLQLVLAFTLFIHGSPYLAALWVAAFAMTVARIVGGA